MTQTTLSDFACMFKAFDRIAKIPKEKIPFWMQCAYREDNYPEGCKCKTCHAKLRSDCRYAAARNRNALVIGGPDFRPECIRGYAVRCGSPGQSREDCDTCRGVPQNTDWIREAIPISGQPEGADE